jgi:hypothetical protein
MQVEVEAADAEEQLRNYQKALNQAKREAEQLLCGNQRSQTELLLASSWNMLVTDMDDRLGPDAYGLGAR